ncbi:OmpA family protein [Motiliproteus coralliicola]|uniref:OmpA family protein n=1 Tax=Motiliproteus coralliicola TaxID=2283196 RepID=A0A369WC42_9GAMM|nr:OmpA family protein [Motiliproteus coralliicola]RDE18891.1 OmpA family protein [Motiliproteus coralliicola]
MKKTLLVAAVSAMMAAPMGAWAHGSCDDDPNHCAFWHDSKGVYVKDSAGDCVRTSSWTADAVVEGCTAMPEPMAKAMAPVEKAPMAPKDSDGDGVIDEKDRCPNTAKGVQVDANGCEFVKFEDIAATLDVKFATDSDAVTSAFDSEMRPIALILSQNPGTVIEINGHTDSTGSAAYNQKLSERRAQAVVDYLVDNYGVNADQLKAIGHGEAMPIADNATSEGRRANRRVETSVQGRVRK